MILEDDINLIDNDIYVDDIGKIGIYLQEDEEILLNAESKSYVWDRRIPCRPYEIKTKIVELFANNRKMFLELTDDRTKRITK